MLITTWWVNLTSIDNIHNFTRLGCEVPSALKCCKQESKRNSSSPYASSNPAASRLRRSSKTQPQPQLVLSTPKAPVQTVEMSVPDVTISTPVNQQIPVPASSMLSSAIATNPTLLISISDNW
uniref:Uncharacterized protein n=1 Tax=Magallana gigas TaxID=29159 RepID=K1PUN2_MAGGI